MREREFQSVRPPRMAGRFYPGDEQSLRMVLKTLLEDSGEAPLQGAAAVMAPHAGYNYSGRIAAPAYRALAAGEFDTLVIIGHDFGAGAGDILGVLPSYDAYETPLGLVEVDTELAAELTEHDPRFVYRDYYHDRDQTIEVHLPFLQYLGVKCRILPMFFGLASVENCRAVVSALQKFGKGRRIRILASSDLSHYPSDGDARELDRKTLSLISSRDLEGLCRWQQNRDMGIPDLEISICSAGGVGVAMLWAEAMQATAVRILKTGNSGDCGDRSRVVGYASLAFVRPDQAEKDTAETESFPAPETRNFLLKTVYDRIAAACRGEEWKSVSAPEQLAELRKPAAVFVTLHKNGRLRGCIGMTEARLPMLEAVEHFAYAAAFEDSRFPQVSEDELPRLNIEISVLSPMKQVSSPDEIIPGRHGVMVSYGGCRGLFLPQVWEQLPDKAEFLSCLCREKAGLPAEAWKNPLCRLEIFTVHAFARDAADLTE